MKKANIKLLVTVALLTAMHMVLSRFCSFNAWNLKIGVAFIPVFIAAWAYGPAPAAMVGGMGDFLGAILFPIGPYFPGFTLSCALTGVIFGLLLHTKQSLPRIVLAVTLNQFGVSLLLTTLWISILFDSPYLALLGVRAVQAILLSAVEVVLITLLSRSASALRRQIKQAA